MKLTGFRGIVLAALTLVAPALCVTQGTSAMAESSAATQAASASRSTVGTASQTADPKYDAQIAQAVRYYEDANFEKALACYEGALKLTPDNAVLKSKIDSTHKNIEYKQQLLEKTPGFDKNRDAILEKRYDKALALYQAGKKDEARAAFTEVWVLGGKYKLAHEYLKAIVNGTTVPAPSTVAANSDAAPTTTDTPAKDDQVAQALDSAKAAAKAGDYVKAVESCSAALKIDSENAKARKALLKYQELQQKAQQESEKLAAANALKAEQEKAQAQAKQNEARVAELLSAGKQNCKDGNFDGGISNADAALQLDPANKKALALKNAAQKSKDESVVQAQKDKELASAQAQKDKELAAAKELKDKELAAAKDQSVKVSGLLDSAKQNCKAGDYDAAAGNIAAVLQIESSNKKALKLQTEIAEAKESAKAQQEKDKLAAIENEKKQKVSDLLAQADAKYQQGDYAGALDGYKGVLAVDSENKSANKQLSKTEKKLAADQEVKEKQVAEAAKVVAPVPLKPVVAEQTTAAVVAPKPVTASLENTKSAGKTETVQPQSAPATNATLTSLPVKKEVVAAPASAATVVQQQPAGESVSRGELARMMRDADVLYARKDMLGARAIWEKVLAADPTNKAAKTLLEETQPEYNALMQDAARRKDLEAKEKSAMDKMSKPITFSTVDEAGNIKPTPLRQLCNTLAMLTGMDVYPAYGGESMITASFVDKPFQEVLDTVLKPIGLKWTRKGDVITITAELKTRVFNLTQDEVARVQTLIENKTLPQILWGESGQPPLKETVLRMEDKLGQLFVQDSPQNIKKLEEFLSSLQKEPKQEIATRIYKIRKNSGPQTRALVEAVLRTEDNPAITMERKVFLQDENLIVRGTLEDLRRVEKLLSDKNIIEGIENSRLIVQTFVIVPREELEAAPDQAAAFFDNVVEVIEILLYRKDGKTKAKEEGRQMWVERPLKQITIVDYADRITAVSDFINSLPQINQQQKREFIFLKYLQVSEDLEDIQKILGLDSSSSDSGSSSSSGGDVQIFSLRRKGEKSLWGGQVRVRLQKVTPNTSDEDADNCTLIINTPTESGQTVSLEENGASQTVGSSYQIEALKISTSGTSNDGTVRLRMTRDSSATATGTNGTTTGAATATTAAATAATAAAAAATTAATPTYTLDQYEKQNALVVSYTDTADLMRVREVVAQLDKPEKQVDIETLFVTVNESRAKQYGASFSLSDRSDPRNLTTGIVDVVNNVAQTGSIPGVAGAASSTASTTAATAINTNAANGSFGSYTKMDMIVKNIFGYYFSADLSMLEAEGVVSMNNGPHICAKHNSEATFELWANAWKYATLTESASTRRTDQTVNMTLTPFIASADSIILDDMEIEVRDPYYDDISGNRGGAVQTLSNDWLSGTTSVGSSTATGVQRNEALQGLFGATGRKRVQTSARVKNGGTIVLGGWTGSYTEDQSTGVPGLRNMPWLGKLLFSRSSHINGRQNLLIFLSAQLID